MDTLTLRLPSELELVEGRKVDEDNLIGMSGGGIWLVSRTGIQDPCDDSVLIGLFRRYSVVGEYILGTTMNPVVEKLRQAYPDLSESLTQIKCFNMLA